MAEADAIDRIGSFGFVGLTNESGQGPPGQIVGQAVPITRAGVDGVAVRRDGDIPQPFAMIAVRDVLSFAHARTLLTQYDTEAKSGPVTMIYNGVSWGRYCVLSVATVSIQVVAASSGGFHGTSAGAILTTRWTLVPIET